MEFILQMIADLFLQGEEKNENIESVKTADTQDVADAAMIAPSVNNNEQEEGENIFGLMEFH
jgi:hypothetical protein